jgi:hypothetical protein
VPQAEQNTAYRKLSRAERFPHTPQIPFLSRTPVHRGLSQTLLSGDAPGSISPGGLAFSVDPRKLKSASRAASISAIFFSAIRRI